MLRYCIGALLCVSCALPAFSQTSTLRVRVIDAHEETPLPGASVRVEGTQLGVATDASGRAAVPGVPAGAQTIVVSYVGYETARLARTFPLADTTAIVVALEEHEESLDELVVGATRTSRTIADTPTRVEVIAGEEIEEKINMDPSGLTMLLSESPGITVQQTSAVSANVTFSIQGLGGRYTQLLRDGFPLYGGFAGGLSLLQVPPLDLAAIEVIKGPASTLYGGDAIAGIVNLVPKRPSETPEQTLLLNATSAGGMDVGGYYARRGAKTGVTVLASGHLQRPYDAEDDGFTNLPATRRVTLSPTVYRYGAGTLEAGLTAMAETRAGGSVTAVADDADGFVERNTSQRLTARVGYDRPVGGDLLVRLRTSGSLFHREIEVPGFRFAGDQRASYSEVSLRRTRQALALVGGADLRTDAFEVHAHSAPLGYTHAVAGGFAQATWDATPAVSLEGGLRVDATNAHGAFVLPKVSALLRVSPLVSVRAGGGLGYKLPTVFIEEAEGEAFRGVQPLAPDVEVETSAGGTLDLNARGVVADKMAFSFNANLFWTRLQHPLIAEAGPQDALIVVNAEGAATTRGVETSGRLDLEPVKLFVGYVLLDAQRDVGGRSERLPLTARHRTYSVLVWEKHGQFRLGLEAYYTGPQRLSSGGNAPGYWIAGVMGEKRFGQFSVFLNLENITDTRQSRTAPIVTGSPAAPAFAEIWGPTDGFVANGGVKVRL